MTYTQTHRLMRSIGQVVRATCLVLILGFVSSSSIQAQASLTIVNAIPPYKLSPTVLSNGHFSISTDYTVPTKGIIYREDGTNNKPVNYTSFFHVKIDNDVYQQSYESDTSGFGVPVQHPIVTQSIFRDTLAGTPRINANSYAVLPSGDTMRFVFTMFPVKRPSGGFIRLSVAVRNSTSQSHRVGVMMLVDTKIGNNDQAPIASAYGYSTVEKQFDRGVGQGIPDFWLALEGNPIAPGLVARGNLRDVDLLEPDRLLFGNWTDFTSQGIRGLGSAMWKERTASNNQYTDSAVLLLWDEEVFAVGLNKIKASTEIGIVDSLSVGIGGGSGGGGGGFGGGGFGIAGIGSCLSVDIVHEAPCGVPGFSPYLPDTLQALYLVSNLDSVKGATNMRIRIEQVPRGLVAPSATTAIIPTNLSAFETGVAALGLVPLPRLLATSYKVPIAVITDPNDKVVLRDTLDVCVPGLKAVLDAKDKTYPPVCPNNVDTLNVNFELKGSRCLSTFSARLTGAPADVALFSIIQPIPTIARADSIITLRVRYAPLVNNYTPTVGVLLTLKDFETMAPGDSTLDFPADTAFITCPSRDAEFEFARTTDTLNFGHICVGDTSIADWDALNIGGCTVSLTSCQYSAILNSTAFSTNPITVFPDQIIRGAKKTVNFIFAPNVAGKFVCRAILQGISAPKLDTLILVGEADVPSINTLASPFILDTVCINQSATKLLELKNTTACPVLVDSVRLAAASNGWTINPAGPFTISPHASLFVTISGNFATVGHFAGTATVYSQSKTFQSQVEVDVVTRAMQSIDTVQFGNVFVDAQSTQSFTITSTGTADLIVSSLSLAGLFPSEYTITLPAGVSLPLRISPGDSLVITVQFRPKDIEQRNANAILLINGGAACALQKNLVILGRGVQPLVDVRSRTLALGRLCIGSVVDTAIAIHNPGNFPLHIDAITATGSPSFTISNLSTVQVDPDSTYKVRVRYTPDQIGIVQTQIRLTTNGKWITPTDTVITLNASGIICGTISADTVDATVGSPLSVPVRFTPNPGSTKTAEQLVQLMNASGNQAMGWSMSYSGNLVRLHSFANTGGIVSNLPSSILTENISSVRLSSGSQNLNQSSILAELRGDVLLSKEYQTVLHIQVDTFANGFSRLQVHDGLLRAQYCAFNNRQVNTNNVLLLMSVDNTIAEPFVHLYADSSLDAELRVYSLDGSLVRTIFSGQLAAGSVHVGFEDIRESGMYLLELRAGDRMLHDKVVLQR